jgi:hypothetical protein
VAPEGTATLVGFSVTLGGDAMDRIAAVVAAVPLGFVNTARKRNPLSDGVAKNESDGNVSKLRLS